MKEFSKDKKSPFQKNKKISGQELNNESGNNFKVINFPEIVSNRSSITLNNKFADKDNPSLIFGSGFGKLNVKS